jgi:hypothetical protein
MIVKRIFRDVAEANLTSLATYDWLIRNCEVHYTQVQAKRPDSYFPSDSWSSELEWEELKNQFKEITGVTKECDGIRISRGDTWAFITTVAFTMEYSLYTESIYTHYIHMDDDTKMVQFKLAVM